MAQSRKTIPMNGIILTCINKDFEGYINDFQTGQKYTDGTSVLSCPNCGSEGFSVQVAPMNGLKLEENPDCITIDDGEEPNLTL
jgi:hypothetical protein